MQGINAGSTVHDHIASDMSDTIPPPNGTNTSTASSPTAHPLSDFDTESSPTLDTLLSPSDNPAPKTVKALFLSHWNPPPYYLRSKGHLLYLLITTNEGDQHHVTSHISGFYVNKSSSNKFDPFPRTTPKSAGAHSLLSLLSKISTSFDSSFKKLLDHNASRDPLSIFQLSNACPASPWVVHASCASLSSHEPDLCRSQESYLMTGAENSDTLRDWNEEFQTTRELPRETVQDRVFRERVTSKLFADYNEAAAQGAVLVARGEVAPLNPTEPGDAQIFVYNNVFYSFGADGVGTFAGEGGHEAARVATSKDVMGVRTVNQLDVPDLSTPGTLIVDFLGRRIVAQSIVPGIFKQREPGENQIDYGGVEGKDVVADNEAFTPLLSKLSSALRVKKHPVWDKDGKRHDLEASVETKGLLGTDGRKYVLDLYRITPVDVHWIEKYWDEDSAPARYPHRMSVLRPELVDSYWRTKLREYIKTKVSQSGSTTNDGEQGAKATPKQDQGGLDGETKMEADFPNETAPDDSEVKSAQEPQAERVDVSDFQLAFNPDVFCGQQPGSEDEKLGLQRDELAVRALSDYLLDDTIPQLVRSALFAQSNLVTEISTLDLRCQGRRGRLSDGWAISQ